MESIWLGGWGGGMGWDNNVNARLRNYVMLCWWNVLARWQLYVVTAHGKYMIGGVGGWGGWDNGVHARLRLRNYVMLRWWHGLAQGVGNVTLLHTYNIYIYIYIYIYIHTLRLGIYIYMCVYIYIFPCCERFGFSRSFFSVWWRTGKWKTQRKEYPPNFCCFSESWEWPKGVPPKW